MLSYLSKTVYTKILQLPQNIYTREIRITAALFILTLMSIGLFYWQLIPVFIQSYSDQRYLEMSIIALYLFISVFILYGNVIYHLTRLGMFTRFKAHRPSANKDLEKYFFDQNPPGVTILIPSYKEEIKVIEQTLWSAALQYYPKKDIVLLIDNPPNSKVKADVDLLNNTRKLIERLQTAFLEINQLHTAYTKEFIDQIDNNVFNFELEKDRLNHFYQTLKNWLGENTPAYQVPTHIDTFFVQHILSAWFEKIHREYKPHLVADLAVDNQIKYFKKQYQKIEGLLNVRFDSFERKLYQNLSQEPNKAMNINSYLHLIGKRIRTYSLHHKQYLEVTKDPNVTTIIPDQKYIITLDADSVILTEYVAKLLHEMEKKENRRLAVIQTPYSAYPGAAEPIEVVAGATTDIQFNIHQGFSYYDSTFWVGANAMLRKSSLEDIKIQAIEGDNLNVKYIQDRTVIEDTESSIDLVKKGWKLLNYPERLAYSSTPPDFGSLIIQRQRWANGGLIIFPKLFKYFFTHPERIKKMAEFFVRTNYLVSIAGINIGTLLLLLIPFKDNIFTIWLPIASLPYYYLYARDLKLSGYRIKDIFRVYAINLLLIPINIAGVLKSIQQGLTGSKIPFVRTPKVGNRVTAQYKFILFIYALLTYTIWAIFFDIYKQQWTHVVYSLVNGGFLLYAIRKFVGFKESWIDLKSQISFLK